MKATLFRGPPQVAAGDGGTGCSQEQVGRPGMAGTWGAGSSMAPRLTSPCSCCPSPQGYSQTHTHGPSPPTR